MSTSDIIKNVIAEGTKEMIRETSVESITVTEICEKTGVNRRTFYRYFRDKFDVINWIYYNDALMKFDHYESWSIFDYMPRIMESLYRDKKYYINALKYKGQNSFRDYCTSCLEKLIKPDYSNWFSSEHQLAFFTHNLCEMTYDACIYWLQYEPNRPPESFSASYRDFLVTYCSRSLDLLITRHESREKEIIVQHSEPAKQ